MVPHCKLEKREIGNGLNGPISTNGGNEDEIRKTWMQRRDASLERGQMGIKKTPTSVAIDPMGRYRALPMVERPLKGCSLV